MTSTETLRIALHSAVLSDLDGSKPKSLARALAYQAEDMVPEAATYADEADFRTALKGARSTDQLVELWRKQLTRWDYADQPAWSDTPPRTDERRAAVHVLLKLEETTRTLLDGLIPVSKAAVSVVISPEHKPWYTPQSQLSRPHYWPAYRNLLASKGWPADAVAALDVATDQVVERLADPTDSAVYQSKGLVVGYVQSGKTANFTGVMAKAVDAGYRLVIVLGGRSTCCEPRPSGAWTWNSSGGRTSCAGRTSWNRTMPTTRPGRPEGSCPSAAFRPLWGRSTSCG